MRSIQEHQRSHVSIHILCDTINCLFSRIETLVNSPSTELM